MFSSATIVNMNQVRTRFAPSPTGFVHVGSIYTALFAYAFAKKNKGQFVLRLEDTDRERFVPEAEEVLYDGLSWVGLMPDEGSKEGGEFGPYRQSERLIIYQQYAKQLVTQGLAYYAFESAEELEKMRADQVAQGLPPKYDRRALQLSPEEVERRLTVGDSYVIRLKVPEGQSLSFTDVVRGEINFQTDGLDDQILLKSDGYPTYHLAVVVDDHLMEVSHVIRAEEWIPSTPKHVLLYRAFGWNLPVYAHLPIIRNPDKSKMSKRHGHADLRWYRQEGFLPEALLNYLGLLGWSHPEEKEKFDLEEFIREFSLERIKPSSPTFDLEKMTWLNGVWIRELEIGKLVDQLIAFHPEFANEDGEYLQAIVSLEQERTHTFKEFVDKTKFFFAEELVYSKDVLIHGEVGEDGKSKEVLQKALTVVQNVSEWTVVGLEQGFEGLLSEFSAYKKKDILMTVRGAVSAQTATPPLFDTLFVLGKDRCLNRLSSSISFLGG